MRHLCVSEQWLSMVSQFVLKYSHIARGYTNLIYHEMCSAFNLTHQVSKENLSIYHRYNQLVAINRTDCYLLPLRGYFFSSCPLSVPLQCE